MVRLTPNSYKLYFVLVHCLNLVVAPGLTLYEKLQVACSGPLPSWDPEIFSHYRTPQSICAKHINDGARGGNAGAWCGFHHHQLGVVFDIDEALPSFVTPRMQLYCISRCRCKKRWINNVEKINGAREIDLYQALDPDALIFFLDLITGETIQIPYPESQGIGPQQVRTSHIKVVPVTSVSLMDVLNLETTTTHQQYYIVPVAGKPIFCGNHILPMQLPAAFYGQNMQQICAARRFGGRINHNAGGVCVKREGAERFQVEFMQELSNPQFYPTTFPLGTAVLAWCQSGCSCELAEAEHDASTSYIGSTTYPSDQSTQSTLPWLGGLPFDFSGGGLRIGAVVLIPQGNWGQGGSQYKMTPAPYPLDKLPWPTEPWSPPPAGYVEPSLLDLLADPKYNTRKILRPNPVTKSDNTETCDGSCQGPCGSECRCQVTREKQTRWIGDTLVFPSFVARCALSAVAASLLGKRSDEEVLGCVCNTTYISLGCCQSADGMVWEDQQLKLGQLDMLDTDSIKG